LEVPWVGFVRADDGRRLVGKWFGLFLPTPPLGRVIAPGLTSKEVAGEPWAQRRDRKLLFGFVNC